MEGKEAAGPASQLMMVAGILILLCALPSGWLADRIGRKQLVALSGVVAAIGTLVLIMSPNMTVIYVGGMLELAEVTALTALKRTECRGSHWRTDHPGRNDEEWLKHSMATYNSDGSPHLEYTGVIITKYQPMERKY
ncbi:MAG: hypothetical protein V3S14_03680 [Anaerolineae bacterium]